MFMKNSLKLNWKIISGCALAIILAVDTVVSMSFSCWAGETSPPIPVRISVAELTAGVSGLRYSANITPRKQVDMAFKVGGYVHEIANLPGPDGIMRDVRAGDRVRQGMVLARLDVKDYA
ncbi:MAG: efflux RND transporter periplasmic adaptor subunit, partial [Actinobacteria bacterium]|nr:efflux RND transporter periplasmic adaptor subunit [Actinomycetota bacterium]